LPDVNAPEPCFGALRVKKVAEASRHRVKEGFVLILYMLLICSEPSGN